MAASLTEPPPRTAYEVRNYDTQFGINTHYSEEAVENVDKMNAMNFTMYALTVFSF